MRKLKLLKIVNFSLIFILIVFIVIAYLFPIILPFNKFWYILIMFVYSIMLYFKYSLFGSDNVLWFAITINLFGIYMLLYNFSVVGFESTPILSIIPAISSFILFCIYKNELHLNLLVLLSITGLPGFLLSYKVLSFWWFVFVEIIANIIAIIVVNIIHRKYKKDS